MASRVVGLALCSLALLTGCQKTGPTVMVLVAVDKAPGVGPLDGLRIAIGDRVVETLGDVPATVGLSVAAEGMNLSVQADGRRQGLTVGRAIASVPSGGGGRAKIQVTLLPLSGPGGDGGNSDGGDGGPGSDGGTDKGDGGDGPGGPEGAGSDGGGPDGTGTDGSADKPDGGGPDGGGPDGTGLDSTFETGSIDGPVCGFGSCAADQICAAGTCAFAPGCRALLAARPGLPDGAYRIDPDGPGGALPGVPLWCDMTTDGGGWTLILKTNASTTAHYTAGVVNIAAMSNPTLDTVAKLSDVFITSLVSVAGTEMRVQTPAVAGKLFVRGNGWSVPKPAVYPQFIMAKTSSGGAYLSGAQCYDGDLGCPADHYCFGYPGITGDPPDILGSTSEAICIRRAATPGIFFNRGVFGPPAYRPGSVWVR